MKGQETVAAELSPEVSPVIVLEDNSAEWQFLQGTRLASSVVAVDAFTAEIPITRVVNPAGSGVLAVFSRIEVIASDAGDVIALGPVLSLDQLTTLGATALRDHRWLSAGATGRNTIVVSSQTATPPLVLSESYWSARVIPNTTNAMVEPFILLPGEAVQWGVLTINTLMRSNIYWSERRLPALER